MIQRSQQKFSYEPNSTAVSLVRERRTTEDRECLLSNVAHWIQMFFDVRWGLCSLGIFSSRSQMPHLFGQGSKALLLIVEA